jgi:hypothetical protein
MSFGMSRIAGGGAGHGVPVRVVFWTAVLLVLGAEARAQQTADSSRARKDSAVVIAPVVMRAEKTELDVVGFNARKRAGVGRFMVRSEIERRQPRTVSAIFRHLPGFRVSTSNARSRIQGTRGGGCMTYFIDNGRYSPVLGTDIDDALPVAEVAAIEIYTFGTTPSEYSTADRGLCSTVVIWTRGRIEDRRTSRRSP